MSIVFTTITETNEGVSDVPKIYREEKNARKEFKRLLKENNIKVNHTDNTGLYANNNYYSVALHINVECSG